MHIEGFKRLKTLDIELDPIFNLIVGNNETGKSTILEALGLALTGKYDGRPVQYAIDPYLFNADNVKEFFLKRQDDENAPPPRILIEAYLHDDDANPLLAKLLGTNNTMNENCPGLAFSISVDTDYTQELKEYAADSSNPTVLPVEYYRVQWRSFANEGVTLKALPFRATSIDTSLARAYWGPNKYLSQVMSSALSDSQQRQLSLAYKKLQHGFSDEQGVSAINQHLEKQGTPSSTNKLSIKMDLSSRSSWDNAISAHLGDLPFDCAGKGEQCRIQLRLAVADASKSRVLLIEEPENHLSYSSLNTLLKEIEDDSSHQQVVITTHSAFVLNKLGVNNLKLLSNNGLTASLTDLSPDTVNYFMKLPGFDTLRLILASKSILVEGPSDELIVQRAYKAKHGKLPLEDGVDVISVRGLAFKRFLEIGALLKLDVRVVTDNDGDVAAVEKKYEGYLKSEHPTISICFDKDEEHSTLEPQLLKANSRDTLNTILGQDFKSDTELLEYMGKSGNKTDCALKMFESTETWNVPGYITNAIE
tara:strand:+ start:203928 stop:205529 length:1602 start_codon:yes stop_codon:yes gene_type:complete